jgi:hypothetical protein
MKIPLPGGARQRVDNGIGFRLIIIEPGPFALLPNTQDHDLAFPKGIPLSHEMECPTDEIS